MLNLIVRLKTNLDQQNEEINKMNNKLLELNKQKLKIQKILKSKDTISGLQKDKVSFFFTCAIPKIFCISQFLISEQNNKVVFIG